MTNNLIAALEAAEGPSRELDANIARAIGWGCVISDPASRGAIVCWREKYRVGDWMPLPRYTASIDAATTLVPPHANTNINIGPSGVHAVKVVFPGGDAVGIGFTPAIALCIAALRAGDVS